MMYIYGYMRVYIYIHVYTCIVFAVDHFPANHPLHCKFTQLQRWCFCLMKLVWRSSLLQLSADGGLMAWMMRVEVGGLMSLPSGNFTQLQKIIIFHGKIYYFYGHCPWLCQSLPEFNGCIVTYDGYASNMVSNCCSRCQATQLALISSRHIANSGN